MRFRANSAFRLVAAEGVPANKRSSWPDDAYGIIVPKGERTGYARSTIVSTSAALLLLTLKKPGQLPYFLRRELNDNTLSELTRLILDGHLELEAEQGFVSGIEALGFLRRLKSAFGFQSEAREKSLSLSALKHAEALVRLGIDDRQAANKVAYIASKLYHYNTAPVSISTSRRLDSVEAVHVFLDLDEVNANADPNWEHVAPDKQAWWHYWRRVDSNAPARFSLDAFKGARTQTECKLYISPTYSHLPHVLRVAVPILERSPATAFKVGANRIGVLRPDKMVAYFSTFQDLQATADELGNALSGVQAQGVPFTCNLTEDSLISWGADPPDDLSTYELDESLDHSWRTWIAHELSKGLFQGCEKACGDVQAYEFALERARLLGVDTENWAPSAIPVA